MLSQKQEKNYAFFSEHLPEYLSDPIKRGKFAVFCYEKLQGIYDSFESAYSDAYSKFPVGEFIIQQIIDAAEIVGFLWSAVK